MWRQQAHWGMPPFTPELWNLVLEYLPIEKVVECKTVSSSELSVAARFALTKGRWKPVAECCRLLSDFCGLGPAEALRRGGDPRYDAAWALDPGLTAAEYVRIQREQSVPSNCVSVFLAVVEPSMDGIGRVIGSLEHAFDRVEDVATMFLDWVDRVGGEDMFRKPRVDQLWTSLWRELERWSDGERAGQLLTGEIFFEWFEGDVSEDYAFRMTASWTGKGGKKRAALIGVIAEIEADFEEQRQKDYMAEHGWKYCKHGEKHWDCPDCSDAWNDPNNWVETKKNDDA